MDDGNTYIDKRRKTSFNGSCEFNLCVSKEEAQEVLEYFQET